MAIYRKGQNQMELFKRAQLQDKQRKQEEERLSKIITNADEATRRFAEHLGSTDIPETERIEDLLNNMRPMISSANDINDYVSRQSSHAIGAENTEIPNMTIEDFKKSQINSENDLKLLLGDVNAKTTFDDANSRTIDTGHPISGDDLARGKHERKLFNQLGF